MTPRITASTPYEQLPVWLTLKEVALYKERNYKAMIDALKVGRCFVSAQKDGGRWMVHKSQVAEPTIERVFKR